ncbi:radical SAM family heme chaperone HemW [Dermabacteraceae bacterium P13138]
MRDLSVYLHIPFCAVRCGYCDFNTYTAEDLGGGGSRAEYPAQAMREMDLTLADDLAAGYEYTQLSTVFFGGGTPTLLPAEDLAAMLRHLTSLLPLAPGAEVTTEANPDSVTPAGLEILASAGLTRVSVGMQSAVPHVLRTLDRTHKPERVGQTVRAAKALGLQTSVDLIYGTPGESLADWRRSLEEAIALEPAHISAYSLIIEGNTAMARKLRRGEIPQPDVDLMADMYELANEMLAAAGYDWYEVSNFARSEEARCRHNIAYWRGSDWWGIGPGAHGHRDGVRSWNVKHPRRYAGLIAQDKLPREGSETLTREDRDLEYIMLGLRMAEGISAAPLTAQQHATARSYVKRGLLRTDAYDAGRLIVTDAGRLLADAIVRDLVA